MRWFFQNPYYYLNSLQLKRACQEGADVISSTLSGDDCGRLGYFWKRERFCWSHKNGDITSHYSAPEIEELIDAVQFVFAKPIHAKLTLLCPSSTLADRPCIRTVQIQTACRIPQSANRAGPGKKRVWPIIAIDAFTPRQIFYRSTGQAHMRGRQTFLDPEETNSTR